MYTCGCGCVGGCVPVFGRSCVSIPESAAKESSIQMVKYLGFALVTSLVILVKHKLLRKVGNSLLGASTLSSVQQLIIMHRCIIL